MIVVYYKWKPKPKQTYFESCSQKGTFSLIMVFHAMNIEHPSPRDSGNLYKDKNYEQFRSEPNSRDRLMQSYRQIFQQRKLIGYGVLLPDTVSIWFLYAK
jgi:hypothetical protein